MTEYTNPIEIPVSKKKLVLALFICMLFLVVSLFLLFVAEGKSNSFLQNEYVLKVVGAMGLLFSLAGMYILTRKLFGSTRGLLVGDEGITMLYTRSGKPIVVPWKDVASIEELSINGTKIVDLQMKNPQAYIDNAPDALSRKTMQFSYNNYGSVLSLSASVLQCSHKELMRILQDRFGLYLVSKIGKDE